MDFAQVAVMNHRPHGARIRRSWRLRPEFPTERTVVLAIWVILALPTLPTADLW